MLSAGFETATPATYALDRAATKVCTFFPKKDNFTLSLVWSEKSTFLSLCLTKGAIGV
jgi:hypothetical protein